MTSEAPLRNDDPSGTASPGPLCGWCEAPLPPAPKGRPRAYCDLSCKSKAARQRIAQRPKPAVVEVSASSAPVAFALPPGVLAAAAEDEPAGPRRRVLELADALAGAAYYFARTVDDSDPTQALTRLRTAVPWFATRLLEQAQAAHDEAVAALAPRPATHLDAPSGHLDGPAVSNRRFEKRASVGGTTPAGTAFGNGTTTPAVASRPGPVESSGPSSAGRPGGPRLTDRFVNQPTPAELEEARRMLSSPQVLARVSPQLRGRDTTPAPVPAPAGGAPQPGNRPAPAAAAAPTREQLRQPADGERLVAAPPTPYERGFGDCDVLLALPRLGAGWELAGWRDNNLAYFVLHDGEIVGWVEIGIGAVPRWAAIIDGHFLTDTATGELLFHASPELAARTVRQARLAPRPGR
ncbi:hypothetical protein OG689_43000 [Kitasatospora sp. NBC_00240]|uniref:hypothetical protein n=1 Tax=Kitasatospora sp. NBC_00240 TaxID=2903567 RepID=UPI002256B96F|nr:hypothetical protein [Kitasatospora sp. NBC_00240]MCX5215913.1 hypothetical protein [Kitasatospora sp. NBC_00240]